MNYTVKAVKIIHLDNGTTTLEDYQKESATYYDAEKEKIRLKLEGYCSIVIHKNRNPRHDY